MNKYILLLCAAMISAYAMEETEVGSTVVPISKSKYKRPLVLMNMGGQVYVRIREDKTLKVITPKKVIQSVKYENDPDGGVALFNIHDAALYNLNAMKFPIRVRITNRKTGKLKQYFIKDPEQLVKDNKYPDWQIVNP